MARIKRWVKWVIGISIAIAALFGILLLLRWGMVQNTGLGDTAEALALVEFPSWFLTAESVLGIGTIFSVFLLIIALYITNKARASRGVF